MKNLLPAFTSLFLLASALPAAPPVVKTVPWVASNPLIPHDTWSGKSVRLKGTSDSQSGGGITYEYAWDFGDGSAVVTGNVTNKYAIEATHTYTAAANTIFTARLTVRNATTGETASQPYYVAIREKTPKVEVNVAIDEGLWYLWKSAGRYTGGQYAWNNSRYGNHYGNTTASALQAFQVHGHRQGQAGDPYAEAVAGGFDYLTANLTVQAMSLQGGENPDSNGNGIGLSWPSDHPIYELGAIMDALVASGTPDATARTGSPSVSGRTYRDLVQDMVDMYAWGQGDSDWFLGGWRYGWNWDSDNSAAQWGAIGMIAAEQVFGCTVPQWVKMRNRTWLDYSFNPGGWFGYQGPGAIKELSTGPCGMVQLSFAGLDVSDAKWVACVDYIRSNWSTFITAGRDTRYYSYYAFTKAMRTALPNPVVTLPAIGGQPELDWYADDTQGLARVLVDRQEADGSWAYDGWPYVGEQTAVGWNLIILSETLFESGAPVAVAKANPNPAVAGQTISLDGTDSFHQDFAKSIVLWEWDTDADGDFDVTGPYANISFPAIGDYPVKLRVADNGTPTKTGETILIVRVTTPPLAPTADAGGPYVFCPGVAKWYLDGTSSSNPDDGLSEPGQPVDRIVEYAWELNGDNSFDDAFGPMPDVTAYFRGLTVGNYVVQVRVTDNTAAAFPSSGQPDLTSIGSSVVVVAESCTCVDDLETRPKGTKVQLTWSHSGAAQYLIYRGTVSGGPYTRIATTNSTYSTWLDNNVRIGATYFYVVRPADALGRELCQSNEASARVLPRGGTTGNKPPVANAGTGQTAAVGQDVTLDGSKSSDPNGDRISFRWSFTSRPDGSAATLSASTVVKPSFRLDKPGSYVIQLVVNDGSVDSPPSSVTVSTLNTPPAADAGPNQSVVVGLMVNLDGSASSDVDGDPITFTWSFASRPAGSTATLSSGTDVKPSFTVDKAGVYSLQLLVNDGQAASAPAFVTISTVNSAPVADAGPNQTAFLLQTVTLDASGSTDADGDALTYEWSFTSRPSGSAATLSSTSAISPEFVVDAHGDYVLQLVVNDGTLNSVPVGTVTVSTTNSPPVANAGPDQPASVGQLITLDGSKSSDVDGDPLTFKWSLTVPGGSAAVLSDAAAVMPVFRLDRPGTYVAQLIANDGTGDGPPDTVTITTLNSPPVADAGFNTTISVPSIHTLDGTASFDADGDGLHFFWSIVSLPLGSTAILSDNSAAKPTVNVDLAGTYVAQLLVDDGTLDSAPVSVTFTTLNSPPLADAGFDQTATVSETIALDGTKSFDVNGDLLAFYWSLVSRPPGSVAVLSDVTAVNPRITIDQPGDYVAQLIVNDGGVDSPPDTVRVSTLNSQPVARAGDDRTVTPGAVVSLDGAASIDADGNALVYRWALTSRPDGSAASLANPTAVDPSFVADLPGTYVVQLVVHDGTLDSAPDTMIVSTSNSRPVARADVLVSPVAGTEGGK